MEISSHDHLPPFRFELLLPRPGIHLNDLKIMDELGNAVEFSSDNGVVTFPGKNVQISYGVTVDYSDCVGVDRDTEFNYPFINDFEIYLSTGLFPFPLELHNIETISFGFDVAGLPDGWQVYSSFISGGASPYKLDNFFWYATTDLDQAPFKIMGIDKSVDFVVAVQKNKTVPITKREFLEFIKGAFSWMEENIGPYKQLDQINILILQAPANYMEITNATTFATGENVMNGILAYGPDDPSGYQMLGCGSYREYLLQGLFHEIMHTYTTTAIQGKHKSVLYPSKECPPEHAGLMGESLNLYFVYRYLGDIFGDENYFVTQLESHLARAKRMGRRNGLLDLYLFDKFLVKQGASLLDLFRVLVNIKQSKPGPYASGKILVETAIDHFGIEVPGGVEKKLLGEAVPEYGSIFENES